MCLLTNPDRASAIELSNNLLPTQTLAGRASPHIPIPWGRDTEHGHWLWDFPEALVYGVAVHCKQLVTGPPAVQIPSVRVSHSPACAFSFSSLNLAVMDLPKVIT